VAQNETILLRPLCYIERKKNQVDWLKNWCLLQPANNRRSIRMAKATNTKATETTEVGTADNTRPIAKFDGTGGLHVAVWKHSAANGSAHYSIRIDRSFRKDGGDMESTPYLRDGDLLRAQRLFQQADDWIEQDKAKFRSSNIRQAGAARS
jgi:hypothetical protein